MSSNDSQSHPAAQQSPSTGSGTGTGTGTYKTLGLLVAAVALTLALLFPSLRSSLPKLFSAPAASPTLARTMATTNGTGAYKVVKRPWNARGHADHGWLYTYHTFSFASYYDPSHMSYGPLRVINEDRVERGTGFGTHSHAEALIFSYIVSGELEHKDSMGNLEILHRGEVQFTSAGTGIRHSEYNRNKNLDTHFLQIWALPDVKGLQPKYKTSKFEDSEKEDKLCRIMESVRRVKEDAESGPIPMHADLSMSASILSPGKSVVHDLVEDGERKVYLHVVMNGKKQPATGGAKIKIGGVELGEGDGAFVNGAKGPGTIEVESVGDKAAEFLLFDMA